MSDETLGTAVVVEPAPPVVTVGKKVKVEKTGDLIMDIAHEVESLTKTKALNLADTLAGTIETDYLRLGGVLKIINDNSWYEGFPTFDDMVYEKFGFQARKARYLISIYENLVSKQIPWEKVQGLGWTKLKDLAPVLTVENVDDWVAKAEKLTVAELQAVLKGKPEDGEKSAKTKSDITTLKFACKPDQLDVIQQALAKGKGELHTEYDVVALENICSGYLGGTSQINKSYDFDAVIQATGFEAALGRICELFPEYDVEVKPADKK